MTILQLAQDIAQHLGPDWAAREGHNGQSAYLLRDVKKRVHLRGDGYNWKESKRLEIWGLYPTYDNQQVLSFYGDRKQARITVAISRGAKAIAKDIERRFLPRYWPLVEEAEALVKQYTARAEKVRLNALAFASIVHESISNGRGGAPGLSDRTVVRLSMRDKIWGQAEIGEDSVKLELRNVPLEMALEIAQVLMKGKETSKEETDARDISRS